MTQLTASDGRMLVVAIDHPLYSWPCVGLEDRDALLQTVTSAGADAIISTYGTIRHHRAQFAAARTILKLDLTTVTLGSHYGTTECVQAWSIDDALRLGVDAVLTFVQLGAPSELEALRTAARVAAAADGAGLDYVCEIMPVTSSRFPRDDDPEAIAAAARTATEIGATVVKTTMPSPPEGVAQAVDCGSPVILAGGDLTNDATSLLGSVRSALAAGAAGVAFGRNAWGAVDPGHMMTELSEAIHGNRALASAGTGGIAPDRS